MAPEVLPIVFDVFAQADRSLDRGRGGLGLGLAIVKGLVELHRGTVDAKSEGLGKGTEITIDLPLERELPPVSPSARQPQSPAKKRRVLVIEDNFDSARTLEMLLKVTGYEVKVAHTGPDGVQAAHDWKPQCVICDIGLPGMDGYAVARHLRQHPSTGRMRLIALTGYGQARDAANARAAGFDEWLVKPADPEKLFDTLEAAPA